METPVFEEIDPASDCACPGCAHWRRALPHSAPRRPSAHPATRRALALAAVTSTALGAGHAAPALAAAHAPLRPGVPAGDEPRSPQGGTAPLHGPAGTPAKPSDAGRMPGITRAEIIERAQKWVDAQVPYSMTSYWEDGYRQDCSGFVSMAWSLRQNEWTGSLHTFGIRITKAELRPGDILLFHNPDNPVNGSHAVLFGGWTDSTQTYYVAYESTRPHARRLITPYAYWVDSSRYVPYRYKGVVEVPPATPPTTPPSPSPTTPPTTPPAEPPATPPTTPPATQPTTPPATPPATTPTSPPATPPATAPTSPPATAPTTPPATPPATLPTTSPEEPPVKPPSPSPTTPPAKPSTTPPAKPSTTPPAKPPATPLATPTPTAPSADAQPDGRSTAMPYPGAARPSAPASHGVPGYPGRAMFRPGANNPYITQLGEQLVKKGFGRHYPNGPGPRWGEADRRGVEAFQRTQGWRGGAADGYPGPETWRRLFS
ncbi:peptidoglycan-binding protein [Streptomyces sp. TRM70350]|uniref:peptidoglycan-binding protein n=1 Tax=Streptomyces sp. TRM70350 TaxID=2856165 RepID=UPI001C4743D2|nr:peptidoglycan-binding protein [Streptomyces sp. TRM70350]MBV7698712.1 peptidoglycan-binding protein [Streptomyces sp. TRM70350]